MESRPRPTSSPTQKITALSYNARQCRELQDVCTGKGCVQGISTAHCTGHRPTRPQTCNGSSSVPQNWLQFSYTSKLELLNRGSGYLDEAKPTLDSLVNNVLCHEHSHAFSCDSWIFVTMISDTMNHHLKWLLNEFVFKFTILPAFQEFTFHQRNIFNCKELTRDAAQKGLPKLKQSATGF